MIENQAVHGTIRSLVFNAFVHPLCVVLAADVYALSFLPAVPLILAATHGPKLLVRKLETCLLGESGQLLLCNAPAQKPVTHYECYVDSLMCAARSR